MKTKKTHPIFTGKIEKFNHEILFKRSYKEILRKRIEGKHGIYALYDKNEELYYIGQTNQMKKRIQYHKKDHHANKWETFSVLFTRRSHYPAFLEDAFISIVGAPKGNKQKPLKIKPLNSQIEKDIREVANKKVDKMVGKKPSKRNTTKQRRRKVVKKRRSSKDQGGNPFKKQVSLIGQYKGGKEHRVFWLASGKVRYKDKNKKYKSLHALTMKIIKRSGRPTIDVYREIWKVKKGNEWVIINNAL